MAAPPAPGPAGRRRRYRSVEGCVRAAIEQLLVARTAERDDVPDGERAVVVDVMGRLAGVMDVMTDAGWGAEFPREGVDA